MSIWDDPELREGGDFVKLENIGDEISGVISALRAHRFNDGSVAPQVIFIDDRDGETRTWTAGQVQSKKKLAELRPDEGDWFKAKLAQIEKRAEGKTLKHIELVVNRGGKPGNQTAPASRPAPAAPQNVDLAAVLAQLSPDQRAALLAQQGANSSPGF